MFSSRVLLLIALSGLLPSAAFCQNEPRAVPVPSDPLELATGPIQELDTPEGRAAALKLVEHARDNYRLPRAGRAYKLKVSFTADSAGQTHYDGPWEMEDTFAPELGHRWTATAAAGYSTTRIDSGSLHYAEGTEDVMPLVLHEARGALLGSMPDPERVDRQRIRTSSASYNGVSLTCVLISGPGKDPVPAEGRHWEETEECIDTQSGLLQVHSLVPGRYALYDYTNGLSFHGHNLPRRVTITEDGKPVIELRVDSLEDISAPNAALFVPTEQMRAMGPATVLAGAIKTPGSHRLGTVPPGSMVQILVIFGLLTPSGQLLEAHSLQPSDPRSEAAVKSAMAHHFSPWTPPGGTPLQREVFVFERFVSGP